MARRDTFKKLDDQFESKLDNFSIGKTNNEDDVLPTKRTVQNNLSIDDLPTKSKSKSVAIEKPKKINDVFSKPVEKINKTFVIDKELADVLESLVRDPKTKKPIQGRKGLISNICCNAIRKELVSLGVIDESELDNLIDY